MYENNSLKSADVRRIVWKNEEIMARSSYIIQLYCLVGLIMNNDLYCHVIHNCFR